jgi:hypothetical protein
MGAKSKPKRSLLPQRQSENVLQGDPTPVSMPHPCQD